MNTLTRTLAAAAAAAGLALGGATVAHTSGKHVSWAQGDATITTGCVIRFYSSGPAVHENGAHACTGATGAWIHDNGALVIDQTYGGPVVSVIAQSDETLVRRGIQAGISGGVGDSHVTFYDTHLGRMLDLTRAADYKRITGPYANLWFSVTQVR